MVLFLDMSASPEWPERWPVLVPIQPGRHQYDYDIVEEQLPIRAAEEMRKQALLRLYNEGGMARAARALLDLPMGINAADVERAGGRIIDTEDNNERV